MTTATSSDSANRAIVSSSTPLLEKTVPNRSRSFILSILVLTAICIGCFWSTLSCYFLADDLIPLFDLSRSFDGHPELLVQRLVSPWLMDKNFLMLYRPFTELSLAFDCLFWRGNPFGYHLTNLLIHVASTICLFLLSRRLLRDFGQRYSSTASFLAAALFAAFPLHTEVVVWIVGRLDGICTVFYLISLLLFVKATQDDCRSALAASVTAFLVSAFSKEMAISLPTVLVIFSLYAQPAGRPWNERVACAVRQVLPFWIAAGIYLVIRALILGHLLGGYVGSVGDLLNERLFERWLGSGSLWKVAYPLNEELLGQHNPITQCLIGFYTLAGLLIVLRSAWCPWQPGITRLMLVLSCWLLTTLTPVIQVWHLAPNLAGNRFLYLGSAPLCLLITLVVLPLDLSNQEPERWKVRVLQEFCAVYLGYLALFFAAGTYLNIGPWLAASDQTKRLRVAIEHKVGELAPGQRLVILNLPRHVHGAYMFYWFEMLQGLLRPPLCGQDISNQVATVEPVFVTSDEALNLSRLRRMAAQRSRFLFCFLDNAAGKLEEVRDLFPETWPAKMVTVSVTKVPAQNNRLGEHYLVGIEPGVKTSNVDFVEIDLVSKPAENGPLEFAQPQSITLSWEDRLNPHANLPNGIGLPLIDDSQPHVYRFPVSERISWILAQRTRLLSLSIPGDHQNRIKAVRFVNGTSVIPALNPEPSTVEEEPDGVCRAKGRRPAFVYDAAHIPGASSVIVEVSNPHELFIQRSQTFRDTMASQHYMRILQLPGLKGRFELPPESVPNNDRFQIRAFAVSKKGRILGTASDPLTLEVAGAPAASAPNWKVLWGKERAS